MNKKLRIIALTTGVLTSLVACGATTSEEGERPGIVDHVLGRPGASDGDGEREPAYCGIGRQVDQAHTAMHAGDDLAPWGGPSGVADSVRSMAELLEDERLAAAARDVADGLDAVADGADMDETFGADPLQRSATDLFDAIAQCPADAGS